MDPLIQDLIDGKIKPEDLTPELITIARARLDQEVMASRQRNAEAEAVLYARLKELKNGRRKLYLALVLMFLGLFLFIATLVFLYTDGVGVKTLGTLAVAFTSTGLGVLLSKSKSE